MIKRLPRSCFCANSTHRILLRKLPASQISLATKCRRSYQTSCKRTNTQIAARDYSPKAALTSIEAKSVPDSINPPRSVLPPVLQLPVRGSGDNIVVYLFRLGKAYGSFYKDGIKAVWYNNKASRLLRGRILKEHGVADVESAALERRITRAEWQLLARNSHDIGKLPFFGLLVVVFGEWLPLLVPFMPAVVPGTCRIPKQIAGMRNSAELRRRRAFRQGTREPSWKEIETQLTEQNHVWPITDKTYLVELLDKLKPEQLHHLSSSLNIHNRVWDILQIRPPTSLLCRALARRLQYLSIDDRLLLHVNSRKPSALLVVDELAIACEERGIDVLAKQEATLRQELDGWLQEQQKDEGKGKALLVMLFRRPSNWFATKSKGQDTT